MGGWREFRSVGVEFVVVGERIRRHALCPSCGERFQLPVHLLQAGRCFDCRSPRERRWWVRREMQALSDAE